MKRWQSGYSIRQMFFGKLQKGTKKTDTVCRHPDEPSVSGVRVNIWAACLDGFSFCWKVGHVGLTLLQRERSNTGDKTNQSVESPVNSWSVPVLHGVCAVVRGGSSSGSLPQRGQQSPDSEPTVLLPQQLQTMDQALQHITQRRFIQYHWRACM